MNQVAGIAKFLHEVKLSECDGFEMRQDNKSTIAISVNGKGMGGKAAKIIVSAALVTWLTTYGVEGKKSDKVDTYKNVKRLGGLVGTATGVAFIGTENQLLQQFGVVPVAVLTAAMLAGRYGAQELAKRYHKKYPLKKADVETVKN